MPKKILPPEEFEEEDYEEDEEEDEEPMPAPPVNRGRPRKAAPVPVRANPKVPATPKARYAWVVQQAAEALIDAETNEVIATDIGQALANVIERLERIENAIGVMQG